MEALRSIGLSTVVLVLGAACGTTTSFMPLNPAPHQLRPRQPSEVQMFTSSTPTQPYVEVGMITIAIDSLYSTADSHEMIATVREEAAKHGCEGVVLTQESTMASASSDGLNGAVAKERTAGFRATCIAFIDRSPTAAVAAATNATPAVAPPSPTPAPAPAPDAPAPAAAAP